MEKNTPSNNSQNINDPFHIQIPPLPKEQTEETLMEGTSGDFNQIQASNPLEEDQLVSSLSENQKISEDYEKWILGWMEKEENNFKKATYIN